MAQKVHHLTKTWYEKLVHELHELKTTELPQVIEQIAEAKEQWDLSENFEYHAAKEKQALLQARIDEIESMLEDVEIVDDKKDDGTIGYGSTVTFSIEGDKEYTVTLVSSAEVDVLGDVPYISFDSPVGSALAGKKLWDVSVIRGLSSGRKNLTVLKVA